MKKRLLSLLCAFVLLAGLLPVTALAAGVPTTLYVGGTSMIDSTDSTKPTYWRNDGQGGITSEGAGESNYNVKYDGNGTLTLKGADIKGTYTFQDSYACGIFADGDLTIQLEDQNTIAISSADTRAAGIFSLASGLTIQGNGSLSVAATADGTKDCSGIYAYSDDSHSGPVSITITDGAQVTAAADGTKDCSGIYAYSDDSHSGPVSITITDGARVEARVSSTGTGYQNSYGIHVGGVSVSASLTIEDAQVTAIADGNGFNLGLIVSSGFLNAGSTGSLSITDSTVDVQVRSTDSIAGSISVGIKKTNNSSEENVTSITGSTVTIRVESAAGATGMELVDTSSGEATPLSITGSTVTVWGSAGTGDGFGALLRCKEDADLKNAVSIQNSTVTVGGASESGAGQGICAVGTGGAQPLDLTASGSLLRITGVGTAEGSGSIGSSGGTDTRTNSIVFENGTGTVSGEATLPEDLTVERGETLTVPSGAKLTVPAGKTLTVAEGGTLINNGTITNNGTIVVYGTFTNSGTLNGSGTVLYKVTGVSLNTTSLSLLTGDSATLTATVTPGNATNPAVTWASNNTNVATVDGSGKVTAVGAGTAAITATAQDGSGKSAACQVTVPQSVYSISADTEALDFGSVYTGYTQPAAKTVTVENTGNQTVTVNLPASANYTITAGAGFAGGAATLAPGDTAAFTVQPNTGLAAGDYDETLTISGSNAVSASVGLSFAVERQASSGGSSGGGVTTYAITVPETAHGKVTVSPKNAAKGKTVTLTATPDEGCELASLTVTDSRGNEIDLTDEGNGEYTFTMPASKVTIAAVFAEIETLPAPLPFADVAESDWFYDAVDFVYQNGLMNGTSGTAFAPDGTMTRAMLVTILHRQAGEPVVNYAMPFDDVTEGTWYSEAVRWAAAEGIVTGTSATTFAPDAPVTREQFAAILYRYAQSEGQGFTGAWAFRLDFDDADAVSEYAYEAMCWLTMHGVIEGSGGSLNPQDSATRAEAAAMLMRYLQL